VLLQVNNNQCILLAAVCTVCCAVSDGSFDEQIRREERGTADNDSVRVTQVPYCCHRVYMLMLHLGKYICMHSPPPTCKFYSHLRLGSVVGIM
jgi:hypothetical protein